VAAVALSQTAPWKECLFAWEELPPAHGEGPQRRIRRPAFPQQQLPPLPRQPVWSAWHKKWRERQLPRPPRVSPEQQSSAPPPRQRKVLLAGVASSLGLVLLLGAWALYYPSPSLRDSRAQRALPSPFTLAMKWRGSLSARILGRPQRLLPGKSTPAASAPVVLNPKEDMPVKKPQQKKVPSASRRKSLGPVGKALGTAAVLHGTGLCHPSPGAPADQVRPPDQDCPPGAHAFLQSIGFRYGSKVDLLVDPQQGRPTDTAPWPSSALAPSSAR
jgi:hypothetical protein